MLMGVGSQLQVQISLAAVICDGLPLSCLICFFPKNISSLVPNPDSPKGRNGLAQPADAYLGFLFSEGASDTDKSVDISKANKPEPERY
jgi:hypothetical protein